MKSPQNQPDRQMNRMGEELSEPPTCLDPIIPSQFINIYLYGNVSLDLVLFMSTCIIVGTNNQTIFFRKRICDFNQTAVPVPALSPYDSLALGVDLSQCSVNIKMYRESENQTLDTTQYMFHNDEIKMWANASRVGVLQWKCNIFPRPDYESILIRSIQDMIIYEYIENSTVPFWTIKKLPKDQSSIVTATVFNSVLIIGAICGFLICIKIMKK